MTVGEGKGRPAQNAGLSSPWALLQAPAMKKGVNKKKGHKCHHFTPGFPSVKWQK